MAQTTKGKESKEQGQKDQEMVAVLSLLLM